MGASRRLDLAVHVHAALSVFALNSQASLAAAFAIAGAAAVAWSAHVVAHEPSAEVVAELAVAEKDAALQNLAARRDACLKSQSSLADLARMNVSDYCGSVFPLHYLCLGHHAQTRPSLHPGTESCKSLATTELGNAHAVLPLRTDHLPAELVNRPD